MGGVAARAARGVFFQVCGVGCAVGAQKEFGRAAGGRRKQRLAVGFALQDRQAIVVGANAAGEDCVAVVEQMLGGDGGTQKWVGFVYVLRGFLGGDVFHHDFEFGEVAPQGNQLLVNENGFAVKQINVGTGHFAMYQEQHASALHGL